MEREEFFHVTKVQPETFDQLDDGAQRQLLVAVEKAIPNATNPREAMKLASDAIRTCCEQWQKAIEFVAHFVVPPGECDSVASLEYKLTTLKEKVGLTPSSLSQYPPPMANSNSAMHPSS